MRTLRGRKDPSGDTGVQTDITLMSGGDYVDGGGGDLDGRVLGMMVM